MVRELKALGSEGVSCVVGDTFFWVAEVGVATCIKWRSGQ